MHSFKGKECSVIQLKVSVPWNTNEMEQVDWPRFSVDLVAFIGKYFR